MSVIATPFFIPGRSGAESDLVSSRSTSLRIDGLARFDGRELVLEWAERVHVAESHITGSRTYEEQTRSGVNVIALDALQSAELRGRWRPRIEIVTSTLAHIADLPLQRPGRLALRLSRQDRALAQELVSEVRLAIAEARLRAAEAPPELPPEGPGRPGSY